MKKIVLRIKWLASRELIYIPLEPLPLPDKIIVDEIKETEDYWLEENRAVVFNTTSERRLMRDGTQEIKIHYSEQNNRGLPSDYYRRVFLWGTSIIGVSADRQSATVIWKGNPADPQYEGAAPCQVLSQDLYQEEEREFSSRRKRKQAAFRRSLLELQQCCAITGEKTQSALEAAHIVEAYANGPESLNNGILLRADIHRMYDASIFEIRCDGSIGICGELSDEYRKILESKTLDKEVLDRVAEALQQRMDNIAVEGW